ncbi:lipoprotein-releasing ABC transporter permease subunit [Bosea sp. (in: a-proteobacteria)]|jgi:lipoprotein-releasing system permease protein|uniref:lipoprotein-releasing ABC transporter permease subunit n=1 Tax=Bosea sp. (in: a-proteobacteria) TaxID=1871050 RepID=UPI001ACA1ADE|nr:lipoprotein-releasing ABC transporter permease subunit [Bosea sp. (in: a-proteobacteria)]MBN9440399.1 lipoprotein-releasing ABC transporter permease subunit [Bosea sp. (in: a-proteobacteria)]MBN9467863.1 lipoprotein-releasing ABC transporter permease subunit [Bosea sp. (in: a-proteobacteria)]
MSTASEAAPVAAVPTGTKPFAGFEWLLAGRYLRTRRREGFVSVIAGFSFLGILLGVATLIIVMSVMNGFRKELLEKIVGVNGHIFATPIDRPLDDYEAVAQRLRKVHGIKFAIPLVEGQALASSQVGNGGVLVRGISEEDIKSIPFVANNIKQGTLDGFGTAGGVAIGRRLAASLGLQAGDTITIVTPRGASTPFGTAPRIKAYPVTAVFEIGMSEFDASFVFMPLGESQAYFNRDGDVNVIEIFIDDPDRTQAVRDAIEADAPRPLVLSDWRQRNRTFFNALEVERNVMFIILTLIVLVAALNIVSGLIMLVKDKTEDIAIMRTMGASRGTVLRVFLITGATIGVVGTLGGLLLGVAFANNIKSIMGAINWITGANLWDPTVRFLSDIPSVIDWREVASVVGMALVLSLLATLYPAWKAARLDPVQALRMG